MSKLLVLTMNAARASVQAMRCFLWSSPLRPGLAVLGGERQGGPPAAEVLAAAGGGSPRSSPDSSPVSSSELRKMAAQPRQSPSGAPDAHAQQTGAGEGGGVCAGSAPPGGMPASRRCLVSHPWHQPPVTLPHQSHGLAPLKPECCRAAAPLRPAVSRCIPSEAAQVGRKVRSANQRWAPGGRMRSGGEGRERQRGRGVAGQGPSVKPVVTVCSARYERSW